MWKSTPRKYLFNSSAGITPLLEWGVLLRGQCLAAAEPAVDFSERWIISASQDQSPAGIRSLFMEKLARGCVWVFFLYSLPLWSELVALWEQKEPPASASSPAGAALRNLWRLSCYPAVFHFVPSLTLTHIKYFRLLSYPPLAIIWSNHTHSIFRLLSSLLNKLIYLVYFLFCELAIKLYKQMIVKWGKGDF